MSELVYLLGLGFVLLYFTFTDIRRRVIPNRVTYPILIVFFLFRLIDAPSYLWGLVPAFFFMLFFLINPRSIGGGDIKMFACIGLIAGFSYTLNILFWTCLTALVHVLFSRWGRKKLNQVLPLAPFTSIGYIVATILNAGGWGTV